MISKYSSRLLEHRWLAVILSLMIVFGMAAGAKNLFFNNDYRVFFSDTDPHLIAFDELQDTYNKSDNVLFVIAPKDGVVFKKETLAAIEDITERAWQTPHSRRVDSLANYQNTTSIEDDLLVENLYEDARDLSDGQIATIKSTALNEPLLVHRLISDKGDITSINITLEFPVTTINESGEEVLVDATVLSTEVGDYAKKMRAHVLATYPDHDVYLTGTVMMNNAFGEASIYDMTHLLPLAVLLILMTVFLLLKSVAATITTFLVVIFSVMMAFGFAGWAGIDLTSPVMSAPIIILTLAVADCVHILSTWISEMRTGKDKITAMHESLRINFMPVFLTSLTTAIGFLSLNTSESPPFNDLGNISAVGVLVAFLLSVSLLPALATLLPSRVTMGTTRTSNIMGVLANWVIKQQKVLLIVMGTISVVLIALIPRNELNDVFVNYFDERIEFRTDTDFVVKNLTGIYFVDYSIEAAQSGDISNPDILANIEKFTNWLETQPEVIHVNTITDTFTRLNKNMHGDDDSYKKLPDSRELAAQYLLLYEMSLPYGLDLNNQIDIDKKSTRITATLETISTQEILAYNARVDAWMLANMPELRTPGVSPSVIFAHIGMTNIISMLSGTTIALLLISLILVVALKSVRYGLLSLIPNLIPAGMAFGLWTLISGEIGLGLSIVTAMTLGIVVDDTIHFLSKYLRARREKGLNAEDAVRYAFSTVGIALWVTSLALIAGFLVLSSSSFLLNSDMGLLTAIVIALALVVDFLFLPPILIKLDGWLSGGQKKETPSEVTTTTQSTT